MIQLQPSTDIHITHDNTKIKSNLHGPRKRHIRNSAWQMWVSLLRNDCIPSYLHYCSTTHKMNITTYMNTTLAAELTLSLAPPLLNLLLPLPHLCRLRQGQNMLRKKSTKEVQCPRKLIIGSIQWIFCPRHIS